MKARKIAAVAAMLLMPCQAYAYDCGPMMRQVESYPAMLETLSGRARSLVVTLTSAVPMQEKIAALVASRPMLDSAMGEAGRMLVLMDEGNANGCVPQGAGAAYVKARESVITILALSHEARTMVDAALKTVGM